MRETAEKTYIGLSGFTAKNISHEVNEILYKSRRKPKYEMRKVFTILTAAGLIVLVSATWVASLPVLNFDKSENFADSGVYSNSITELASSTASQMNNRHVMLALDGSVSNSAKSKRVVITDNGESLSSGKITVKIIDEIRTNPFLPYKEFSTEDMKFELIEPPESLVSGSDAERILDTAVSGILYDPYNPSAILNVEGTEYLVKRGDSINNYHVLDINNKQVVVKLGKNVYHAGVGEILTEGNVNPSNIPNLERKFGGANGY